MKFKVTVEGDLERILAEEVREGERGIKRAVTVAGQGLQRDWRAQISRAGLGQRLPRTIRMRAYPTNGESLNSAALVWSNAPEIIGTFETGAVIRSKDGFWLAIPTPLAGTKGLGRKRITPGGWERRTGMRLRFVYRRNGPSLLVADNTRINARGRAVPSRAKPGRDGIRKGAATSIIFWLVPQVTLRKRLDLMKAADDWAAALPAIITQYWRD